MSAHTPGPWRVRNAGERRKTIVEADQGGVAHVIKQGLPTDGPNARLIAAAPDLLAALAALVDEVRAWDADGSVEALDATGYDMRGCLNSARAAIRKATEG